MKRKPSTEATDVWIRLMRVQGKVLGAVEQDLKKAGFPPLAWYMRTAEFSDSLHEYQFENSPGLLVTP